MLYYAAASSTQKRQDRGIHTEKAPKAKQMAFEAFRIPCSEKPIVFLL